MILNKKMYVLLSVFAIGSGACFASGAVDVPAQANQNKSVAPLDNDKAVALTKQLLGILAAGEAVRIEVFIEKIKEIKELWELFDKREIRLLVNPDGSAVIVSKSDLEKKAAPSADCPKIEDIALKWSAAERLAVANWAS